MERIGRYEIVRLLGSGSFATVWLARDPDLAADVAIKVLADNWSRSDDTVRRFMDEARAMRAIDSDRILRVHDVGRTDDGRPYMVCEYADLGNLQERMAQRGGRFTVAEAITIAIDIAECLSDAHDRRIVHRDLKPSNVMFRSLPPERAAPGRTDRMLLGDFGIARNLEGAMGQTMVVGSPHYMAPEQGDASTASMVDERADVYAAAVILHELLAGRVPFPYDSVGQVQRAQQEQDPAPIQTIRPEVSPTLAAVLARGLSRVAQDRYPTARAWRDALRESSAQTAGAATYVETTGPPGAASIPPVVPPSAGAASIPPPFVASPGAASIPPPPAQSPSAPQQDHGAAATSSPKGAGGGSAGSGGGGGSKSAGTPKPGRGRAGKVAAVVVAVALAAGAGVFIGTRNAAAGEVLLEPVTSVGPEPFFQSPGGTEPTPDGTVDPTTTPTGPTGQATDQPTDEPTINPSTPTGPVADLLKRVKGLYGGSGSDTTCDVKALAAFLETNVDKARAWAEVHGIGPGKIREYLESLVPLSLLKDIRVTNHGFRNGAATIRQAALQAGTKVLVDLFGRPRVRCKCGNPLLDPQAVKGRVTYKGQKWVGFQVAALVTPPRSSSDLPLFTQSPTPTQKPTPKATPKPTVAPTVVNLSKGASARASSTFSGEFPARLGIDGDNSTSWFSSGAAAGPSVYTISLRVASTVTRIEFVNNGAHDNSAFQSGFGFRQWTIEFFDAAGKSLRKVGNSSSGLSSQTVRLPGILGVRTVKFTGVGHEAHNCGGFAELRVIGYTT